MSKFAQTARRLSTVVSGVNPGPPPVPPDAPVLAGEWGTGLGQGSVLLTWTDEGQDSTKVFRKIDAGAYVLIATVLAPIMFRIDVGIAGSGTEYYYYVVATNGAGDSPDSNVVNMHDADA